MNNKIQIFEQFLTTSPVDIPLIELSINFILAIAVSLLIRATYVRCGISLTNRRQLAATFTMFIIATTLIISVVKSSLALSLGLVGALSVIRFRTAIKEPEELMYLFFCIAVGLGLGANQRVATIFGSAVILAIIWISYVFRKAETTKDIKITIVYQGKNKPSLDAIIGVLREHCVFVDLRRLDESDERFEASFNIEFINAKHMSEFREGINKLGDGLSITLLDDKGILQA